MPAQQMLLPVKSSETWLIVLVRLSCPLGEWTTVVLMENPPSGVGRVLRLLLDSLHEAFASAASRAEVDSGG